MLIQGTSKRCQVNGPEPIIHAYTIRKYSVRLNLLSLIPFSSPLMTKSSHEFSNLGLNTIDRVYEPITLQLDHHCLGV